MKTSNLANKDEPRAHVGNKRNVVNTERGDTEQERNEKSKRDGKKHKQ